MIANRLPIEETTETCVELTELQSGNVDELLTKTDHSAAAADSDKEIKRGGDDLFQLLADYKENFPKQWEKQHVRDIYFSFGVPIVVLMPICLYYKICYRLNEGEWPIAIDFSAFKSKELDAHVWMALSLITVFLVQVVSGTQMNIPKYGSYLRSVHVGDGWVGAAIILATASTGIYITHYLWDTLFFPTKGFIYSILFGSTVMILTIAGVYTAKIKKFDVHKDLMYGMIIWMFFGGAVNRFINRCAIILWPNAEILFYFGFSQAIVYIFAQPLLLSIIYYRAGRLYEWYNLVSIFFSIALGIFCSTAIPLN